MKKRARIIPLLLYKNSGLVKTVKFTDPKYIGDPVNSLKIFNEKEADEIIFLDIDASRNNKGPDFNLVSRIANECFMPFCYGGGITLLDDIKKLLFIGVEKIAVNNIILKNKDFLRKATDEFGCSTIVASIDVKKNVWGNYKVYSYKHNKSLDIDVIDYAKQIQDQGAGEILLNMVDRDGMMVGYDTLLIKRISESIDIPLIACGGAGNLQHLKEAISAGAAAAAAGSMFVYMGIHKAVLISYPSNQEIISI